MPGTNYSPEEFEETEQALAGVNENIEGHKTVVELRKLIDSKEDLENMRMELIGEAQTEARFTNIFIDTFDEQFRLGEKAGLNLEDFLIKYEEGVQTFLRRLPHEVAGVRDDELGMALEYALTILDKEDVGEADFERLTDLLTDFRNTAKKISNGREIPIKLAKEEETSKEKITTVKSKELVYEKGGRTRDGYFYSSKLYVNAIDSTGNDARVYLDKDMRRVLGLDSFTSARRDLIRAHMPAELEVVEKISLRNNRYYVLTEAELARWTSAIKSEMPSSAEVMAQFLPVGEWPRLEGDTVSDDELESKTTSPSVSDPERAAFLKELKPSREINTKFFSSDRVYSAFVYDRDGRNVVVVATDKTRNADYIFWADDDEWIGIAQRMKLDVITGAYPQFVGRLIHSGDWRERLTKFLSGERDTVGASALV
ncbi:MAG TPA: hypothetical protein VJJ22_03205 [Candidatus Paceibacterota bacterium]